MAPEGGPAPSTAPGEWSFPLSSTPQAANSPWKGLQPATFIFLGLHILTTSPTRTRQPLFPFYRRSHRGSMELEEPPRLAQAYPAPHGWTLNRQVFPHATTCL